MNLQAFHTPRIDVKITKVSLRYKGTYSHSLRRKLKKIERKLENNEGKKFNVENSQTGQNPHEQRRKYTLYNIIQLHYFSFCPYYSHKTFSTSLLSISNVSPYKKKYTQNIF